MADTDPSFEAVISGYSTSSLPIEAGLVALARAGDSEAFAGLVEMYWGAIYNYLLRFTGEVEQAQDLTQETFLKAFQAIGKLRPESQLQFRPWLYRIATNLAISLARRKSKRRLIPFDWFGESNDLPDSLASPLDRSLASEQSRAVVDALAKLPADQVAILLLRFYHDLSNEEIGTILGIRPEAVRARTYRARQAFGRVFSQNEEGQN